MIWRLSLRVVVLHVQNDLFWGGIRTGELVVILASISSATAASWPAGRG